MSYQPVYGDYGVVGTTGVFGRLIQIGTLSRWNHAVIYIGNNEVVEATPKGVIVSPVTKYPKGTIAWNQHEGITPEERTAVVAEAHKLVGKPYDFFTILVLALRILGIKLLSNMYVLKRLAEKDGFICSELVDHCYDVAGRTISDKPDYLTTPGDLAFRLIYQ